MAKAKTTKRTTATKTRAKAKRKRIVDRHPEWSSGPLPDCEPGPNAAAITAAIEKYFAERRTRKHR
ncbi:MAG TPA: hypothetical protein VJ276_01260 [Thermoanaerobaculia bacterium]|nr:hypothetical protein [Thermoanaerobaculia bacterium]